MRKEENTRRSKESHNGAHGCAREHGTSCALHHTFDSRFDDGFFSWILDAQKDSEGPARFVPVESEMSEEEQCSPVST